MATVSTEHKAQAEELRKLRTDLAEVYEAIRDALHTPPLRGHDAIMFAHPIKAPFLEMYDSLTAMANEIDLGKWTGGE